MKLEEYTYYWCSEVESSFQIYIYCFSGSGVDVRMQLQYACIPSIFVAAGL